MYWDRNQKRWAGWIIYGIYDGNPMAPNFQEKISCQGIHMQATGTNTVFNSHIVVSFRTS